MNPAIKKFLSRMMAKRGAKGGKSKSAAKAKAARLNGLKAWPKKFTLKFW